MTETTTETPTRETRAGHPRRLGFLINVPFSEQAPGGVSQGLRDALELFHIAEGLGYDSGWVRNRHFDNYLSSPLPFLAAAATRTERIHLGTAIVTLGYEHPIRLAEDAATVDLLSEGRLELGIGGGFPSFADVFGDDSEGWQARTYAKVDRFLEAVEGGALGTSPRGELRVRPHSLGLRDRIWYGPGGVATATTAGSQGIDLLVSTIAPNRDLPFDQAQLVQIDAHRAAWARTDRAPRVTASRLFFPALTDAQRALYLAYAQERAAEGPAASRPAGALAPVEDGRRAIPFGQPGITSPVHVGDPDEIVAELREDVALSASDDVLIFLPPGFTHTQNIELLENIAEHVAPALGWAPKGDHS